MQQHRIKYFNILLHSFAVANKSLTGLLPEHVLQASDVGSPLDLLFVQIVIEALHALRRLAVLLPVLLDDASGFGVEHRHVMHTPRPVWGP